METISDLFSMLHYGKHTALTAEALYKIYCSNFPHTFFSQSLKEVHLNDTPISLDSFKRRLRKLSSEARHQGTRIIGDESGYYISLNNNEWSAYKLTRFSAIKEELVSFACCEKISVRDLIKDVYSVNVANPSYELELK